MALTITQDLVTVNAADAILSWLGGTSEFALSTVRKIQGTGCLMDCIDAVASPVFKYPVTSSDLTGGL